MYWAVVKIVVNTGAAELVGCIVGPFLTEDTAKQYAEAAGRYSLGYEKWVVRELQQPNPL